MNSAVFLDRDGVLNKDKSGYTFKIEDLELLPGVVEGLRKLQDYYFLIIVTNQSGIGKGYYTIKDYKKFREYMHYQLKNNGINITKEYFCKHHPEASIEKYRKNCRNRKPGIGMLEKAKKEHGINFNKSWMIGDKPTDITAGLNVGAKTIGIVSPESNKIKLKEAGAHYVVNNLDEAAEVILRRENAIIN